MIAWPKPKIMRILDILEYLGRQSIAVLLSYGALIFLGIGILDYYSGPELGVSIFYLLPISLLTWFVGLGGGLAASFAGALTWLSADLLHNKSYVNNLTPYWNATVRLGFFAVIVLLQYALKNEQLRARVDPLTRIGNRRYFFQAANLELERSRRYSRPFTVAYMDLDNFKTVNDMFGHKTGDSLLKTVSKTIKDNVRSTDTAARLGGDEFALLLPETEADAAREFINKLNVQLIDAMQKKNWPVTFSIGAMTFISPPDSVDDMVAKVDAIMYSVKKAGKNNMRFEVFTE